MVYLTKRALKPIGLKEMVKNRMLQLTLGTFLWRWAKIAPNNLAGIRYLTDMIASMGTATLEQKIVNTMRHYTLAIYFSEIRAREFFKVCA